MSLWQHWCVFCFWYWDIEKWPGLAFGWAQAKCLLPMCVNCIELLYERTGLDALPILEHLVQEFPVLTPKKPPGQTIHPGNPRSQPLILILLDFSFCIGRYPSRCPHCARSEALVAACRRPLTFSSTSVHLVRTTFQEIMIAATLLYQDSDVVGLQSEEKVKKWELIILVDVYI